MARLFQNFDAFNGYHKRLLFETEKYTTHNLPWKNKMLTYSLKPTSEKDPSNLMKAVLAKDENFLYYTTT